MSLDLPVRPADAARPPVRRTAARAGRSLLELLTGPHGTDRYLELLDPKLARDRQLAEVVAVRHETDDVVTLTMTPPRGWAEGTLARPVPGQAVNLTVEVDGVRHRRSFSVASLAPTSWTVTIRANPTGTVSRHLVAGAARGLLVEVGPPFGEMVLPADAGRDGGLLLVSGGSGITPVMAMLRRLREHQHLAPIGSPLAETPAVLPRIAFLHYARTEQDTIFADELTALAAGYVNLDLVVVHTDVAQPDSAARGLSGFFTPAHAEALRIDPSTARVFVCGPGPLAGAVTSWLQDPAGPTGGSTERLTVEFFQPPLIAAPADGDSGGAITLSTSGTALDSDGRSILEQAEDAGLRPEHGCRMGICHSCTRHVTTGSVRNLIDGTVETATDASPVEARICVSTAHGDCAIDL